MCTQKFQNITHFYVQCSQILISDCQYLEVILRNDVLASKGSLHGIYGVHQTSNERTSWKSGSNAIWYFADWKGWFIGELEDIGTKTSKIKSNGYRGRRSPSDVRKDEWNKDGDIIVQCVNDKGKIILLTLESSAYNPLAFFLFSKAALA